MDTNLLTVQNLTVEFPRGRSTFRAVDDVSFSIPRGTTLGLVGESGCGKSTIARSIVRLIKPNAGSIMFEGADLAVLPDRALRPIRRRVQMVFQDPYGSLDPHLNAEQIVVEPLRVQGAMPKSRQVARARELLDRVGLPRTSYQRRPNEFSGGQRQRIGIARSLASDPELLVLDEATSALDVSVQAQVLELLVDLQAERGLTYLVISHNLGVVKAISERMVVMRAGQVVESGATTDVLSDPTQEYTRRLRRSALEPTTMSGVKPRAAIHEVAVSRTRETAMRSRSTISAPLTRGTRSISRADTDKGEL